MRFFEHELDNVRFEYSEDFLRVTRGRQRRCFSENITYADMILLEHLKTLERAQW